ncbi:MAG TPA: hypothetical protein VF668_05285 [Pyrinomonadaceae bacterium]
MKKIFAAILTAATFMLAAAVVTADAQVANDKLGDANSDAMFQRRAGCDPDARPAGDGELAPLTGRLRPPPVSGRTSLSDAAPEPGQKPPAEGANAASGKILPALTAADPSGGDSPEGRGEATRARARFHWGAAVKQSLLFLSIQHGYALTQPKTRRDLSGPFFKDYFRSVRSLHGWADGGRFFTNYVAHPMQGSLLGFVQVQNDPAGSRLRVGDPGYWRSRMKALAWSAAWSTQFEIGLVSQASIGNVGLHGKQTYVDVVMTPTAGTALLVAEDALDRYVIERLERRSQSRYVRIFARMTLNPTRTAANLLRFKKPWHRDAGLR